jgi:hypothetical protein
VSSPEQARPGGYDSPDEAMDAADYWCVQHIDAPHDQRWATSGPP